MEFRKNVKKGVSGLKDMLREASEYYKDHEIEAVFSGGAGFWSSALLGAYSIGVNNNELMNVSIIGMEISITAVVTSAAVIVAREIKERVEDSDIKQKFKQLLHV